MTWLTKQHLTVTKSFWKSKNLIAPWSKFKSGHSQANVEGILGGGYYPPHPVWPGGENFKAFGNLFKVFFQILNFFFFCDKCWAKYGTNYIAIWTHCGQTLCDKTWICLRHKQLVLYPLTLSTILPSTGQNKRYVNTLPYETSVISIMVGHFDYKHRCTVEKNVPIALILPSRWQDGAESLGMEHISCLCLRVKSGFKSY